MNQPLTQKTINQLALKTYQKFRNNGLWFPIVDSLTDIETQQIHFELIIIHRTIPTEPEPIPFAPGFDTREQAIEFHDFQTNPMKLYPRQLTAILPTTWLIANVTSEQPVPIPPQTIKKLNEYKPGEPPKDPPIDLDFFRTH